MLCCFSFSILRLDYPVPARGATKSRHHLNIFNTKILRMAPGKKNKNDSEFTQVIKKKQQLDLSDEKPGQQPVATSVPPSFQQRLSQLKMIIEQIKLDIHSPFRKPTKGAKAFLKEAIAEYERVLKASLGVPTYTDNSTLQYEAPNDIPTAPLSGLVPIQRTAYVTKNATAGTTAGGFYCDLIASDLSNWIGTSTGKYFRVKSVTSWTVPRADGNAQQGTFAGQQVPVQYGSSGTEVLPTWSENWEPLGQGFAGIVTKFPLGGFPLYSAADTTVICSHFTALGGTGGVTNIPVVFHVVIETLI